MNIKSLIDQFSNGGLTPIEVTKNSLALAKKHSEIFIEICENEALEAAQQSAKRWEAKAPLSSLDGIPFSVKDMLDVAGYTTTRGSKLFSDIRYENAEVIQHLLSAGAILIGKTTLSEFAYSGLGINNNFGTPTITVKGEEYVVGGSSSGSAASVHKNIVSFSIATDTAGSIRVPSSYTGLVGFRPSRNRYGKKGAAPLAKTFDSIGTIGFSMKEIISVDSALSKSSKRKLLRNNIFYDEKFIEILDLNSEVKENFYKSIEAIRNKGIEVKSIEIPTLMKTYELIKNIGWLGSIESFSTYHEIMGSDEFKEKVDPFIFNRLKNSNNLNTVEISELYQKRYELKKNLNSEIGNATYLLPTTATTAPKLNVVKNSLESFKKHNFDALKITMIGSFLDNPGIAIPNGFDKSGLHTSILLSQCTGLDNELIDCALSIEPFIKII